MNANTFRALEIDRIRTLLAQQAGSVRGRELVRDLEPLTDPGAVREAQARTSEARRLLETLGREPYQDLPDPDRALATARVQGAHLEPRELGNLASFIEGGVEIAQAVSRSEDTPRLARLASGVRDTSEIAGAIRRAILPSGEVADDASPRLAETRRTLARLRSTLTSVMEGYLRTPETERILQDKIITTRNDRYVLLLKADHKGQLPGIIHGGSGTGASLFVEPLPAVELNNDIVSLQDQERQEVLRILRDLTAQAGDRADDLVEMVAILGELDAAQAMALVAQEMDAHAPEIVDDLSLKLIDSRHPLLMPAVGERLGLARTEEPVPVSLEAGGDEPVLVISGPNTGGKTVALKTVGLFAFMAQSGLHVPAARGSRLPVFKSLYADIGDDQSIAENLSTFSAHLAAVVEMTEDMERPALVLLDEVGAGTDPTEGGALGVAIVDHFRKREAMVLATTHHGLMKSYAQSTPGVACASFGYDPDTWEPTYRLTLGAPGRSLALEMAERLGLPAEVVADARARRDDKEQQAEDLLARLEKDRAELEKETARIATARREAEVAREEAETTAREIVQKKRREVERFARELKRRGIEQEERAVQAIRDAVQKLEEAARLSKTAPRLRTEAVKTIRSSRQELLEDPELELPVEKSAPAAPLVVGARARWTALGMAGEVMALHGDQEAEIAVEGKRLRVPRSELVVIEGQRPQGGGTAVAVREGSTGAVPAEINLIGLTVDEALPRVDKVLDAAALSDRREIRVIHGFGSGRLKKAVAGLLDGHPHVASFRQGQSAEGGGGATIVELKD